MRWPRARAGRLTPLINTVGVLELIVASAIACDRPTVVERLTVLLRMPIGY